mmetsp:Transcript_21300/g.24298  ORF Transcript_21300/g.24298 Transcript_21300/m.24298 type:complete len:501 (-) Transcript_21300:153-1655(-)|eukprot:CAMPEP_0194182972 /NCGR_PEP_ID=MMETSP0154-20130528/28559_1 /TAXON_ID=1049557 /ORGANISM="Thalassiothrix antarctica, Strain L6-D1" /LENGTH=500 /DNA_ID=CAMNT_0038899601 /DNA_START=206 /DNA_END=1711 /DNA_ORIENTATION=+
MTSSLAADKGLVMGNIVSPQRMELLRDLASVQKPQSVVRENLDSLMLSKRQFSMIYNEMVNMGVEESDLSAIRVEQKNLKREMARQAVELGRQTIATQESIRQIKARLADITITPSSPLDFAKCNFRSLPLSSDDLRLDVQYFRNEGNRDSASSLANQVSIHVSNAFQGNVSPKSSSDMSNAARTFMESQHSNHDIDGTIVITASCTHRQATVIDPFVLDPMKAVSSWNTMFPTDKIRTDPDSIYRAALEYNENDENEDENNRNVISILSGATYGSSFVGMVHMLKTNEDMSRQSGESTASSMKKMMTSHLSVAEQSGDFGVSNNFGKLMKELMSKTTYSTHCNLVTEGIIPIITSNTMKTTVASLRPDPKEIMAQLAAIQGSNDMVVNDSMESIANKAKTGAQFMKLNSSYLKDTVSALGSYDSDQNKVIDMNSLMTAFEDYVAKAIAGNSGTPINFFLRELTRKDIAASYIKKYYPNGADTQRNAIAGTIGNTQQQQE